ncbi:hypothetical protein AB0K51_12445 [Kitasatospora sp. NPDC049285]|uniref:hypothetical protein n=1 Tax=Kitasatospora sp. NPDC049285 TaxID=3157096 RepID=UPI003425D3C5
MSPSPSSEVPAEQAEPTIPQQRPNSPLFQEPATPPSPDPLSSPSSNPNPSDSPSSPSGEDPTWSTPAPDDLPSGPGGSGGTPSGGEPVRITRAAIQKGLSGVLDTVTRQLARIAADPVEQHYGLWRPEDGEIEAIARPAARIAFRRLPEGATGNSDALDVVDLVLALGGYVWRNVSMRQQLRAARQLGDAGESAPAAA